MYNAFRFAALIACGVPLLFADNVTFTYTANGTGSLNGTPFTNDSFVLVFTGNSTGTDVIPVTGMLALAGLGMQH
jgi:hypothetical protein